MSILTTKNIFFFLVFIKLNFILCQEEKCSTIKHCLKCTKENKCDKCEFGYRLNYDDTKCVKSFLTRYGKRRIGYLHNSTSSDTNDTLTNFTSSKEQEANSSNAKSSTNKPSTSSNKEAESSKKSSASSKKSESSNKPSASSNKPTSSLNSTS